MVHYGSKKASRPYERIHAHCGTCDGYNQTPIKSGRALEKRRAKNEINSQLSGAID